MRDTGHIHPLTWTIRDCVRIFAEMGFTVASAPELDTVVNNFDKLNFPSDHPAREMQDTLWIDNERLMRTHTTNAQIHTLAQIEKPPVRLVVPGRVYRNEKTDATHLVDFFQLDGFVIDKGITMGHLMATLEEFARQYFGPETKVRFRPSYFPFTEPSLEVSVHFNGKWLELLGAGMIHPNVVREMGLNPEEYSGFAFGFGIDRFMAVRYGITDVRVAYSGDYRFLKQFPGADEVNK